MSKKLITCALPYANGSIHIGHLVEYIQADIYVRYLRLRGHRIAFICADDTHGTAIVLKAEQEGVSPETLIARMSAEHQRDFKSFGVEFDHYGSTHSPSNESLCREFWDSMLEAGVVETREVEQLFDKAKGIFLADRYVRGECPCCGAADQFGDSCTQCGGTYNATDLIEPVSTVSATQPVIQKAQHYFIKLEPFQRWLQKWTQDEGRMHPEIARHLQESFLCKPLRDWDVSRPAPYFGFEIPGSPGEYWYVWFDAPIGYISATQDWCTLHGDELAAWWKSPGTEILHFIGKDITYFHTLFWPAMLKTAGYQLPRSIHIHGFLTINGEKMSKSKGTLIKAADYLEEINPEFLRYYYAAKLNGKPHDLNLNSADFVMRVNSDLINNLVNIECRIVTLLERHCGSRLAHLDNAGRVLWESTRKLAETVGSHFEALEFAEAIRIIQSACTRINTYLERTEPWRLVKNDPGAAAATLTGAINAFRVVVTLVQPVLPIFAGDFARLIGVDELSWTGMADPIEDRQISGFNRLFERLDEERVHQTFGGLETDREASEVGTE